MLGTNEWHGITSDGLCNGLKMTYMAQVAVWACGLLTLGSDSVVGVLDQWPDLRGGEESPENLSFFREEDRVKKKMFSSRKRGSSKKGE